MTSGTRSTGLDVEFLPCYKRICNVFAVGGGRMRLDRVAAGWVVLGLDESARLWGRVAVKLVVAVWPLRQFLTKYAAGV